MSVARTKDPIADVPDQGARRALPRPGLAARAAVLGLITTALSVAGSWIPSVWGDEATSILSSERSLPSLFRMLGHVDAVHGTYYLLLHFWVGLFDASAFSVRVPSAIAAGVAAAGVVVLATRLAGPRVGIFAGIVFAVLPRTTYMGEEARGYALSAACAVWVTILLVHLLSSRASRVTWVAYAISVAACGYVFLFSLLLLPVHAVLVITYRRDLLRRWLAWLCAAVAIAAPVIVYGIAEEGQIAFLSARTAATFNSVTIGQWFGNPVFATLAWAAIAVTLALGTRSWVRNRADSRRRCSPAPSTPGTPSLVLVGALWLILPMSILLGVNWVHAVYSSRYLSFAAPAAALLIGWLIGQSGRVVVSVLALAAVVATVAPTYLAQRTVYAKNSSDWSVDAAYIDSHATPGSGILFDESTRPSRRPRLAMRAYPNSFEGLKDLALETPWWATDSWRDSTYPLDDVASRLLGVGTVWLIEYRSAGTSGDTYDLPTLENYGYSIVQRQYEYRSVIIELKETD
ncbi:MAG TPA: glycosyltransferase family 39 protein [Galbitalea sp.]|jgi:mannosyltransferase|nr:glycosyltransferase family 39 protein [Galbitalea sp.]